jgi:ubiquinone/menaquinone biosynthesis C-methylase UbiE
VSTTDVIFAGSIPETYNRYNASLLFQPYADDLALRVKALAPKRLLETAAGTGIVTRALREVLPASSQIVATDLNPAMIEFARRETPQGVTWRQADAQALPFPDLQFDVGVCQFGVMFFPDRVAGYREALRVLRPGGTFLFNVWGRVEDNEVTDIVVRALSDIFPNDPPQFFQRTPFGYNDTKLIEAEVRRAGFSSVQIEAVRKVSRAASARDAATGLCQGTPLRAEIEARAPARLEDVTKQVGDALMARYGSSAIAAPMQALVVVAE